MRGCLCEAEAGVVVFAVTVIKTAILMVDGISGVERKLRGSLKLVFRMEWRDQDVKCRCQVEVKLGIKLLKYPPIQISEAESLVRCMK